MIGRASTSQTDHGATKSPFFYIFKKYNIVHGLQTDMNLSGTHRRSGRRASTCETFSHVDPSFLSLQNYIIYKYKEYSILTNHVKINKKQNKLKKCNEKVGEICPQLSPSNHLALYFTQKKKKKSNGELYLLNHLFFV